MARKYYPTDVRKQAMKVRSAWHQISQALTFGDLNVMALDNDLEKIEALEHEIRLLRTQLVDKTNQRFDLCLSLWEKVKRVRSGVKGHFGDDSSQYEMVGGTRASERKPRARKTASAS